MGGGGGCGGSVITNHLGGLVNKALGPEWGRSRFENQRGFASDLKVGILMTVLPRAWSFGVSARTGWLGSGILWLDDIASLQHARFFSQRIRHGEHIVTH